MVEVLLAGIVLGFVFSTVLGLVIVAFLQYKRGNNVNASQDSLLKIIKN